MKQINLLGQTNRLKFPAGFKIPYRPSTFLTIFAFILIGFEILFLATFYKNLGKEITASEQYLSDLSGEQTALQRELIKIKSEKKVKPQQDIVERLKQDNQTLLKILEAVSSSLPENAWLDALSQKENKITIQGFTTNHAIVSRYFAELENSKYFEWIKIVKIEQLSRKEGLVKKFMIVCQY